MGILKHQYRLPEVLGAHRETANWLVGLSTAGLAGLGIFFDKPREPGSIIEIFYGLAALLFVIVIVAGVAFHLYITVFTNCYEQYERRREEHDHIENGDRCTKHQEAGKPAVPKEPTEAEKKRLNQLGTEMSHWDVLRDKQRRGYKRSYFILTISFYLAVVCSSVYLVSIARKSGVASAPSTGDVLVLDGRHQTDTCKGYSALLLDTKTGQVFELHNDETTGGTRWDLAHAYARKVCTDSVQVLGNHGDHRENLSHSESDSFNVQSSADSIAGKR